MSELLPHQKKIAEKRYFQLEEKSWEDIVNGRVFPAIFAKELEKEENLGWPGEIEQKIREKCRQLLLDRKFLFNTPTWINAGMPGARTLSACFVGELKDDMLGPGGILDCSTWFGTVQKFGGGTGIDLSALRAKGSPIKSTHGHACGPLMVLKYLAVTSQMITQGGARDGANMAVMSVYHPDIVEFIKCKSTESKYLLELPREIAQQKVDTGEWTVEAGQVYVDYCKKMGVYQLFNMSVAVDNKFMRAAQKYVGCMPQDADKAGAWTEELPCGLMIAEVWDLMIDQSYESGDPGILFMERAQEFARFHSIYIPNATNPCGEQFLPEHGSCNLGSIDLAKFVNHMSNCYSSWDFAVHWDKLEEAIKLAVHMLDNVVSINKHPIDKIGKVNDEERRIGLGIMGWADVLLKLGIPYDSDLALEAANEFASFFKRIAHQASVDLAKERGTFPLCSVVLQAARINPIDMTKINACRGPDLPYMPDEPRRNATVTTIAPTGTISLMAGCSSGIEPHFMLCYEHDGLAEHGGLGLIWASDTLRELFEQYKSDAGKLSQDYKVSDFEIDLRADLSWKPANEISINYHVMHQAIWQRYIDNSISKTLNLPNNATRFQIAQTFLLSYDQGCKGSTVYRDGCKPFQPLNAPKVQQEEIEPSEATKLATKGDWIKGPSDKVNDLKWQAREMLRISILGLPEPVRSTEGFSYCIECGVKWEGVHHNSKGLCGECWGLYDQAQTFVDANPMPAPPTEVVTPGVRIKKRRDKITHGVTIKEVTSDGSLYVTINRGYRDEPFELFARVGKAGGKAAAYTEAIGRLISMALQYNIPIEEIQKELRGIKDGDPVGFGPNRVLSVPDGIGKAIEEFLEYEMAEEAGVEMIELAPVVPAVEHQLVDACPECGATLFREEGCSGGKCIYCGFSKCQ